MLRIGFIYNFDDRAWLGGRNYYSGLFNAVHSVAPNDVFLERDGAWKRID